jgi:hypothetical protein
MRRLSTFHGLGDDSVPDTITMDDSSDPATNDVSVSSGSSWSDTLSSALKSIAGAVPSVAQGYLQIRTLSQLDSLNMQRVSSGLQPLTPQQVGIANNTPGINVGFSSGLQSTVNWGLVGVLGVGVLAVVMFSKKGKG